jgi:hypothetical protein
MDKITILATVLSILSIVFAIVSLISLRTGSVDISFGKDDFVIKFKDGSKFNVKNGLNNFGEAEKLIDALIAVYTGENVESKTEPEKFTTVTESDNIDQS